MESGVFFSDYAKDMSWRRTPAQKIRIVLVIAVAVALPWFADNYQLTLLNQIGIAAIGAIGLNILVGFTGQISLGQGGFMAVGAYSSALLVKHLDLPFYAAIPVACLTTAAVGAFFGIPSLRLKGLYLAIATLAAQQIILWVITHWDAVTGGVDALVIPSPKLFGEKVNSDFRFYWVILFCLTLTVIATANLFRSRVGRAFIAIRDQDIAAEVMGVNLFWYKLLAFATSSFFVGLAGALTAHYRTIITWERFTIEVSILYLAMIIIGGLGSVSGSIYGAGFMILLPALLDNAGRALGGSFTALDRIIPFIQQALFGSVIIIFLIFEPQGLAKIWRNIKDYFRLWPFSY
jgi:branched-chain amino acid transport system permease protein